MSPSSPGPAGSPELREEDEIFGNLVFELAAGLELTKRLMARFEAGGLDESARDEARTGVRHLAVEGRIGFASLVRVGQEAPELFPRYAVALRVATRLAYCLLALSGEEPESLALLSPAELESILRDEGGDEQLESLVSLVPAGAQRPDGEQ